MDKRIITPLVVVCVISLLIGFSIGKISQKEGVEQEKLVQTQQELNWLKSELEMFYPPLPEEIYRLSGMVTEVGDDFLVMESQIQISQFPLPGKEQFETRNIKVNVTEAAEIFRLEMIELSLPGELEEGPREPFKKVISSFEDIKVGEYITVISKENIKDKEEIIAGQIEIYY